MKSYVYISAMLLLASLGFYVQASEWLAPDTVAGKQRAAVCFACHAQDGISRIPGTPHLAGQERMYLEKALHAYREGLQRQDPTMTAMAKPLSDLDIKNIAAYFNLLPSMDKQQIASTETTSKKAPASESVASVAPKTEVAVKPETAPKPVAVARSGKDVYQSNCMACHNTGAAGAPKLGDKDAWAPRIAQGMDTLIHNALQGLNAMPPKGACGNCSEDEIKAAVDFMIQQ